MNAPQDGVGRWVTGIPGQKLPVLVDGFAVRPPVHDGVRCAHYLLTHFHSDHYWGLRARFDAGAIYCSPITASLVVSNIGVARERIKVLPVGVTAVLGDVGLRVTPIDANHCPGAVMFLIESMADVAAPASLVKPPGSSSSSSSRFIALHTGDFRAAPPLIAAVRDALRVRGAARLDRLYLDTTYALPPRKWRLPPQHAVLSALTAWCRAAAARDADVLFVVGMYAIGKERVLRAVAEGVGGARVIPATPERAAMLAQCGHGGMLATEGAAARIGEADRDHALSTGPATQGARGTAVCVGEPRDAGGTAAQPGGCDLDAGEALPHAGGGAGSGGPPPPVIAAALRDVSNPERLEQVFVHGGLAGGKGRGKGAACGARAAFRAKYGGGLAPGARTEGEDGGGVPLTQPAAPELPRRARVIGFHCSGWRLRKDQVPAHPDEAAPIRSARAAAHDNSDADADADADANAPSATPHFPTWRSKSGVATTVQVPYSEHSSWDELVAFVAAVRPRVLIPTVAHDAAARRRIVDALTGPQQTSLARYFVPAGGGNGNSSSSTQAKHAAEVIDLDASSSGGEGGGDRERAVRPAVVDVGDGGGDASDDGVVIVDPGTCELPPQGRAENVIVLDDDDDDDDVPGVKRVARAQAQGKRRRM